VGDRKDALQVVAYLRATKAGEPLWSEDCVCEDAVYPSCPDGSDEDCISMPLVRQSDAMAALEEAEAEVERLRGALKHIESPVHWEQANVPEGHDLDYPMLMHMLASPEYYKRVARDALSKTQGLSHSSGQR
jgi:hypothetical protein